MEHVKIPAGEIHAPHNWRAANAAARAAIAVSAEDVGKYCWQQDDNSEWMLVSADPAQWVQRGDMLASRYDADGDGKVWAAVAADTAPWAGVTGKPADYPPSAHGHAIADVAGLQPALDAKEAAGAAAAAVSAHVALADPHTQYTTAAEAAAAAPVQSVAGKTGAVALVKADVGLGNVDDTSDANKPVSTAQQAALDSKAPIASPTFTGTVSGITKAMVGLDNVDNTSDANKPVSTAAQAALNLKANLASPALTGTPTAPTAAVGTNTTQVATTAFAVAQIASQTSLTAAASKIPVSDAASVLDPSWLENNQTFQRLVGAIAYATDLAGHAAGSPLVLAQATPSGTTVGNRGNVAFDSSYLYICTAKNVWKRVALTSF